MPVLIHHTTLMYWVLDVKLHAFSVSDLGGGQWSALRFSLFPPGECASRYFAVLLNLLNDRLYEGVYLSMKLCNVNDTCANRLMTFSTFAFSTVNPLHLTEERMCSAG
jgi:hypothetical protein